MTLSEGNMLSINLTPGNSKENIYLTTGRHTLLDDLADSTRILPS